MTAPTIPDMTTANVQVASNSSNVIDLVVPIPTGAVAGNHVVVFASWRATSSTISVQSWTGGDSWVEKADETVGIATVARYVIHLTETPPASVTLRCTTAARCSAIAIRVVGASDGDPTDVLGAWGVQGAQTWVAPEVTTTDAETLLLCLSTGANGTSVPIAPDPAMTEVAEVNAINNTQGSWCEVAQQALSTAGATGTRTVTAEGAAATAGASLWALKGAATGPTNASMTADPVAVTLTAPVGTMAGSDGEPPPVNVTMTPDSVIYGGGPYGGGPYGGEPVPWLWLIAEPGAMTATTGASEPVNAAMTSTPATITLSAPAGTVTATTPAGATSVSLTASPATLTITALAGTVTATRPATGEGRDLRVTVGTPYVDHNDGRGVTLHAQSTEYVHLVIGGRDASSLLTSNILVAIGNRDTWLPVGLYTETDDGFRVSVLVGPDGVAELTPGIARVWVRIIDNPERPVILAGSLVVNP